MMFVTIILVLFILLILISIANSLIFMSLKLVTREHYHERYLILPAFLTLVLWLLTYIALVNVIAAITKTSVFDAISASVFNTASFRQYIPSLIIPIIIIVIIMLSLQALIFLTVNIDYTKLYNKLRYHGKQKIEKVSNKFRKHEYHDMITGETLTGTSNTHIEKVDEKYKLEYINAFVCSLFIFSLLFFICILCFWIGSSIGRKLI